MSRSALVYWYRWSYIACSILWYLILHTTLIVNEVRDYVLTEHAPTVLRHVEREKGVGDWSFRAAWEIRVAEFHPSWLERVGSGLL